MEHDNDAPDPAPGTLSAQRTRTAEAIVRAAMAIVAADGITGLSMSALAEAAGVSRQTLYKYYPDVDTVLGGMAAMGSAGLGELATRVETAADSRAGLRVFVGAMLESAAQGHPSQLALAAAVPGSVREALRGHEEAVEALVVEILRRGRDRGDFRADLDVELDGRLIYRASMAAHDLAAEPGADVEALTAHVTAALLRIVEATTPAD